MTGVHAGTEAEVGLHHSHVTDRALGNEFARTDHGGDVARPHRFHQEHSLLAGHADDRLSLLGVHGEGLLAQDGLALLEEQDAVVLVEGMRRRHVDGINVRIGGKGVPSIYSSASPWVGSQPCGAKYPGFCADSKGV